MTAGYEPNSPVASGSSDAERLGPLPPRGPHTGALPAALPAQPTAAWPVPAAPHPALPPKRRGGALPLILVSVLFVVAVVQGALLYSVSSKLDKANKSAASAQQSDATRLKALEDRAGRLEQKTGGSLDAADVASSVRPSVFRVATKYATGTAFALGKAPAGGGTDLITNYHVVQEAYEQGERTVSLERTDQRFPGKVIEAHPAQDLVLIHTDEVFPRLVAATTAPKVGDPVLVVGAPLGLEDTVTTGVVSAFRSLSGEDLMQFDAAINPGNSGGPVFNAKKEVVGVAQLKAKAEGIGLAIPISVVCDTVKVC